MKQKSDASLIWLVTLFLSVAGHGLNAEDWRPRSQVYQIQEARQDCSVIKAVFLTTQQNLERSNRDLKELTQSTKSLFNSLKECQRKNGIVSSDSLDANSKTAELCSEMFDFWVLEGSHLMVVEDEIQRLREDLSTLKGAVSRKCSPTLVAELK